MKSWKARLSVAPAWLVAFLLTLIPGGLGAQSRGHEHKQTITVIEELIRGNQRFASGHLRHPHSTLARVRETARGQHPAAIVLACADSRVSPELLFDKGVGDLFDVRMRMRLPRSSTEYGTSTWLQL
jgi:carbonic anhydrase